GAVYVPLDPEYPVERLAFMVEDAAVEVVLLHQLSKEKLPSCDAKIIEVDKVLATAIEVSSVIEVERAATDPAYMIYTSGSTGKPKGAINTHGGIVNRLWWMQSEYQLQPADS